MVFNSVIFLIGFLPVFLLCYYLAPNNARTGILLVGSLLFYAFGEPFYIFFLIISMIINYFLGKGISPNSSLGLRMKRFLFGCSLLWNLSILVLFKWAPGGLKLPLGVSFYTFQIVSYLIDLYKGRIRKEPDFWHLCTYICMFPQLVAGPIVLYEEVEENLYCPQISTKNLERGFLDFVHGLVLKVVLADRLSILWHEISTLGFVNMTFGVAWIGAISYSLQIYFDFYGYSRMAMGLGEMLGFQMPENFHTPYASMSVREFYRRWHMTLGRWFQKYVYIPLGGNRKGSFRTIMNLAVVWFLTAIWHGVGIHFLLWALIVFVAIALEKCFYRKSYKTFSASNTEGQRQKSWKRFIMNGLQHGYVLLVIVISWMCFAIDQLDQLGVYLSRMFFVSKSTGIAEFFTEKLLYKYGVYLILGLFLATPLAERILDKGKRIGIGKLLAVVLFWICVRSVMIMGNNPFLYFRF